MSLLKKYSYWIHSGKYTAIQKFAVLGMGTISFMLLARVLGPAGFGVWGMFLTISSIVETARTSLIKNAFIRFMNQTEEGEHASLQASALVLSFFISGVLALIFFFVGPPVAHWLNADDLGGMLQWYAFSLLISVGFAHYEMLLNAKMDFRGVCYMYVIRQGLLVSAIAFCTVRHMTVTPYMLSVLYLVTLVIGSLTGFFFARKYLEFAFDRYNVWFSKLWAFGKYVFGNNVASQFFRSTDTFTTSKLIGPGTSGQYNACLRISNLVDLPSQVLGDILFPKVAKFSAEDKGSVKHMYERTVGAILIFSIPSLLVLIAFPELILRILAGSKFLSAAPVLRVTAFFGFTLPFMKQFGTIMDATGHPDGNMRVMVTAFIINVGTNWAGVAMFGMIGAAIGTATTYFIIFIVSQRILHKKFGIRWTNAFRQAWALYGELFTTSKGIVAKLMKQKHAA